MKKTTALLSGRNSSMPEKLVFNACEERVQVKEDLKFLHANGFISPKYFSKKKDVKRKVKAPALTVPKLKASFSEDFDYLERLRGSTNHYSEFRELAKPSQKNLNHLCPVSTPKIPKSLLSPIASVLPMRIHSNYLKESMESLKSTKFRIKKAKECISAARRLSKRYS